MTTARLSFALFLSAASLFASQNAPAPLIKGRVVDADSKPIADVLVFSAKSENAPRLRALVATPSKIKTDADGRFSATLAPGSYDWVFRKTGFVSKRLRAQKISKKSHAIEVTLEPGVTKFDFLQKGHWTVHVLGTSGDVKRKYPFEIEDGIAVDVQL